jgi:hypothetical protein
MQPGEEHHYHLQVVERTATKDPLRFEDRKRVIIFSPKDFEGYQTHKHLFNHVGAEILHDPSLIIEPKE